MDDPRFDCEHLDPARRACYGAAVDEMLDAREPATAAADPRVRPPSALLVLVRRQSLPVGGTYYLANLRDGCRHPLRVGINAIGRAAENDIVLESPKDACGARPNVISRRHCVILVHASGGCELFDTASRNQVQVNRQTVTRAELNPGDLLTLCDQRLLLAWAGPNGEQLPEAEPERASKQLSLNEVPKEWLETAYDKEWPFPESATD